MNAKMICDIQLNPTRARGFSLIEVLVAMLILAIGVMGVGALQLSTYRQLSTSHNFGNASMLAGEIADRMLANRTQALANAYNHTTLPGSTPTNCSTATCNLAQMAAYDVYQWQILVTGNIASGTKTPGSLPSGTGAVAQVGTSNDYTITVRWDDDLSGSTGTTCPTTASTDLDCYVITVGIPI